MFVKNIATIARFFLLLSPVAIGAAVGCGGSSDSSGKGGSSGTAGHGGTTGTAGTTGTGGTGGGSGGSGSFPSCTPMMVPASAAGILDFTTVTGSAQATFAYGGTFIFPDAGLQPDLMGITSDVTGGNWHITGLVRDYSGFGLYLSCKLDLSAFAGIQFDVQGTFTGNGIGDGGVPATTVTMSVGDAETDVDSAHASMPPTWGTCVPATGSQYDGTCASATKVIPLTGTSVTQKVFWTDLRGGKKVGATGLTPDPTQITSIAWAMPWSGTGSPQYTVDITVDNIKFMTP